jgi:hypothetical protein
MSSPFHGRSGHEASHAFTFMNPRLRDGVVVHGRRSVLKTSLAGLGALTMPSLMKLRAEGSATKSQKSVILLWMTGGPSHIDTWDPKPDRPIENRGPFKTIQTKLPGVRICEFLPKQAAMLDQFTLIRSVDCRFSNHEPNMVMQTANLTNEPRTNPKAKYCPSFGSIVAKHHGANHPSMPPYVVLNMKSRSHVAWGGYLGTQYDPFDGNNASKLFQLPSGLSMARLHARQTLSRQMDGLRADIDASGMMGAMLCKPSRGPTSLMRMFMWRGPWRCGRGRSRGAPPGRRRGRRRCRRGASVSGRSHRGPRQACRGTPHRA